MTINFEKECQDLVAYCTHWVKNTAKFTGGRNFVWCGEKINDLEKGCDKHGLPISCGSHSCLNKDAGTIKCCGECNFKKEFS